MYLWAGLLVVCAIILWRTAWVCDDAYIMYRCVDNLLSGHGLTFNPGSRVQAFTHPLWALLHVPVMAVLGNPYIGGLLLSMGASIATMGIALRAHRHAPSPMLFMTAAFISSSAFMDYSTSGLENPLSHLLLVLIVITWSGSGEVSKKLSRSAILAGFLVFNRMDLLLLVAPALIVLLWQYRKPRGIGIVLLGFLPLIGWECIALTYYGFLFPNPAYAKLNISLSKTELLAQGGYYFQNLALWDTVTFILIFAGLIVSIRRREMRPLGLGIALYLLYILWIGGDFMSGRFFTAPLVVALMILAQCDFKQKVYLIGAGALLLLGLASRTPSLLSRATLGQDHEQALAEGFHGIVDERQYYFAGAGLITERPFRTSPANSLVEDGRNLNKTPGKFYLAGQLGFLGYYAGPEKHVLDRYAITDPFLAQIPSVYMPDERPGHYRRVFPEGYIESLTEGGNRIQDEDAADLYRSVQQVTEGDIWTTERWEAIMELNFSRKYRHGLSGDYWHIPVKEKLSLTDSNSNYTGPTELNGYAGVGFQWSSNSIPSRIYLDVQSDCDYVFAFMLGDKVLRGEILRGTPGSSSMHSIDLTPPGDIRPDGIAIYPYGAVSRCALDNVWAED